MRLLGLAISANLLLALAALPGCATVDPRPDYADARNLVTQSTDAPDLYDPSVDAGTHEQIDEWMADGLTTDEAVQIALLNNPRLQATMLSIGIARADLVQAGLLRNPTLGIGVLLPSGGGLANLQMDLAQNISDLWQIRPRKEAAAAELHATILQVAYEAVTLAARTKSTYFEVVGVQQQVALASQNLETTRKLHQATIGRRDAGVGTELDVNLSRELQVEAELALIQAELRAQQSLRQLAELLGWTEPDNLRLNDSLPEEPAVALEADVLVDAALQHRLDAQVAFRRVTAAAHAYHLERRRSLPELDAGIGFERDERRSVSKPSTAYRLGRALISADRVAGLQLDPVPDTPDDQEYILGPSFSVELPIFDRNQAQIARAGYAYLESIKSFEAVVQAMVNEVHDAAQRTSAAWKSVTLFRGEAVPLAERNLRLAIESYETGRATFLYVLEAQRSYLQMQTRYLDSLIAAAKTIPELELRVGLPASKLPN